MATHASHHPTSEILGGLFLIERRKTMPDKNVLTKIKERIEKRPLLASALIALFPGLAVGALFSVPTFPRDHREHCLGRADLSEPVRQFPPVAAPL